MSHERHGPAAARPAAVYVVTLSDTRHEETDTSGATIRASLIEAGHRIAGSRIVREDPVTLRGALEAVLDGQGYDVVIVDGGTGIAPRDLAFDILADLYERPIPGFGELFRALSFAEIGAAAMLSRASAGLARGKLVFSLPGSTGAVRLALSKLILPELSHMLGEMLRARDPEMPR